MLDFRMDTFLAVCRHMNFTKAARELHITQPAVTQHIHFIEKEYGIQLFSFQGKKISLTGEGRRLLGAVTTMKHDDMALRRMFDEEKAGERQLITSFHCQYGRASGKAGPRGDRFCPGGGIF